MGVLSQYESPPAVDLLVTYSPLSPLRFPVRLSPLIEGCCGRIPSSVLTSFTLHYHTRRGVPSQREAHESPLGWGSCNAALTVCTLADRPPHRYLSHPVLL